MTRERTSPGRAIVFGASGTLGGAVVRRLSEEGVRTVKASRRQDVGHGWVTTSGDDWVSPLGAEAFDRIIFAHGQNASGGISSSSPEEVNELLEANVLSIIRWLQDLQQANLVSKPSRICIVSSVWATLARQDKLAYVVSKSAVTGLTRSLCADLGPEGIAVNAVLPGVIDTPMTRQFLSPDSIRKLEKETPTGSLVTSEQVAEVCVWLTSPQSGGICGQCLVLDNGWSGTRYV